MNSTHVTTIRAESLSEVQQMGRVDFSILFVPQSLRLHENRVLQVVELLLVGSGKVIILLEGENPLWGQLESSAGALSRLRLSSRSDQLLVLRVSGNLGIEDAVMNSVLSHLSHLQSSRQTHSTGKQRTREKGGSLSSKGPSLQQLLAVSAVPSSFGASLRGALQTLVPATSAAPSWNKTRPHVLAALQSSLQAWQVEHGTALLGDDEGSNSICAALRRVALRCLADFARDFAEQHRDYVLRAFEKSLRKLPGHSQSRANLQKLAKSLSKRHADLVRSLEEDISTLARSALPGSGAENLRLTLDTQHMVSALAADLFAAVEQQLKRLVLAGTLNPFLRSHSFPPVRIGLHYLFYPQMPTVSGDLYDEHRPGVCEKRADALRFDGVAQYPFDFNETPVSTETQESWVDLVKAFFTV
eukprot:gene28696-34644_t